jgi:hypothetical protein
LPHQKLTKLVSSLQIEPGLSRNTRIAGVVVGFALHPCKTAIRSLALPVLHAPAKQHRNKVQKDISVMDEVDEQGSTGAQATNARTRDT